MLLLLLQAAELSQFSSHIHIIHTNATESLLEGGDCHAVTILTAIAVLLKAEHPFD